MGATIDNGDDLPDDFELPAYASDFVVRNLAMVNVMNAARA